MTMQIVVRDVIETTVRCHPQTFGPHPDRRAVERAVASAEEAATLINDAYRRWWPKPRAREVAIIGACKAALQLEFGQ